MSAGMSPIVKTVTRLVTTFITLFGIYIVLYGHLSPGGGFAGGAILAAGLILMLLAFGRGPTFEMFNHQVALGWDCGGALAFLAVAVLGYLAGMFFGNFLGPGDAYQLDSAGTVPLSNLAIGAKVGAGLFGAFVALALFRPGRGWEEQA
jgi:multicomponent Na+:H+ antiporter subunit B